MIELIPFRELAVDEHASVFHDLVERNSDVLKRRYMGGVAVKYGGSETDARRNMEVAIRADASSASPGKIERFAVNTTEPLPGTLATNGLVGALTRFRELDARAQRLPLPPLITRTPLLQSILTSTFAFTRPEVNVSAWVDEDITDADSTKTFTLATAYSLGSEGLEENELAWTFEPLASETSYAHRALEAAEFVKLGQPGRFDVGESVWTIPPQMDVYVRGRLPQAM
jgi:hypothetical protein